MGGVSEEPKAAVPPTEAPTAGVGESEAEETNTVPAVEVERIPEDVLRQMARMRLNYQFGRRA